MNLFVLALLAIIRSCVLVIPCISCIAFTFWFLDIKESVGIIRLPPVSFKFIVALILCLFWLFLCCDYGYYIACACSDHEGIYTKNGLIKYCKRTNWTSDEHEMSKAHDCFNISRVSSELYIIKIKCLISIFYVLAI